MTRIGDDITRRLEYLPAHFVEHEYHRAKYACGTWLSRIDARSGVEIPVSTLADWTAGVGDLVAPLVERLAQRGLAAAIVRTDATGLKVLDPQSPEPIQRGSIWALYSVRTPGE